MGDATKPLVKVRILVCQERPIGKYIAVGHAADNSEKFSKKTGLK